MRDDDAQVSRRLIEYPVEVKKTEVGHDVIEKESQFSGRGEAEVGAEPLSPEPGASGWCTVGAEL